MQNILIVKTAATGDVVRTTVLLHVLKGNIYWITDFQNTVLFPDDIANLTLISSHDIPNEIYNIEFDLIINLEESIKMARLVSNFKFKRLSGVYWDGKMLEYSPDSTSWFDMSLISKLGKQSANELKKQNTLTYQHLIFKMIGFRFSEEPYIIHKSTVFNHEQVKIGIENRTGARWPNKGWHGYRELQKMLLQDGFDVIVFEQRNNLREYFQDIRQCALIISGDTLAMHVALAYNIPCLAIFNCTSPAEIFDYGILKKIVSPLIMQAYYRQDKISEIIHSIPLIEVYSETKKLMAP